MKNAVRAIAVVGACLLGGCASYQVVPVASGDKQTKGMRYWRPAPYLLVSAGNENATPGAAAKNEGPQVLTYKIIYLPDPNECYAIQYRSGLGTTEMNATLENGWQLTAFGGKTDSKVPETITAAGSVLATALGAFTPKATGAEAAPVQVGPGLYKIDLSSTPATLTRVQLSLR